MPDLPVIMIAEDDEAIQAVIEDALNEGGFEVEIIASGEEAMTLLLADKYRALVIDINLRGRGAAMLAFACRSEQHSIDQALRRCAARHGYFRLAQHRAAASGSI